MSDNDAADDGDWKGAGDDDGDDGDFDGDDDGGGKKKKKSPAKKGKKGEAKKKEPKKKADKKAPAAPKRKATTPSTTPASPVKRVKTDAPSPAPASLAAAAAAAAASAIPKSSGSVKEKIIETVSDTKAKPMILAYLTQQNRPYSHLQLWENLHRAVKKTSIPKILEVLESEKKLQSKVFSKTKLYMVLQDPNAVVDQKEIDTMDEQLTELQSQVAEEKAAVKALEEGVSALLSSPTDAEADAQLAALEKEVSAASSRLKKLSDGGGGGGEVFTQAQVDAIQTEFNTSFARWKRFKRAVDDMVGTILEGAAKSKKPKKVFEDVGIESDEEAGVSILKFLPLLKVLPKTGTPKLNGYSTTGVSKTVSSPPPPTMPAAGAPTGSRAVPMDTKEDDGDGGGGDEGDEKRNGHDADDGAAVAAGGEDVEANVEATAEGEPGDD